MTAKKVVCSGCGEEFYSVRPDRYYQFCSGECREIVEEQAEEFIDDRHATKLITNPLWVVQKLNQISQ